MQAALVDDLELANQRLSHDAFYFPLSNWLATLMYLRPAVCA